MAMFRCDECGHLFEEGEQKTRKEIIGEIGCEPVTIEKSCCPLCGGSYEEIFSCKVCGSGFCEDELNGGVCNSCFESYKNDIETCYKISKGETTPVKINCFLASMFLEEEIEEILMEKLREKAKTEDVDCSSFINDDKMWFGEMLEFEVQK